MIRTWDCRKIFSKLGTWFSSERRHWGQVAQLFYRLNAPPVTQPSPTASKLQTTRHTIHDARVPRRSWRASQRWRNFVGDPAMKPAQRRLCSAARRRGSRSACIQHTVCFTRLQTSETSMYKLAHRNTVSTNQAWPISRRYPGYVFF